MLIFRDRNLFKLSYMAKKEEKKVKITMKENKFTFCHIGEIVCTLERVYGNDAEFGAEIRKMIVANNSVKND